MIDFDRAKFREQIAEEDPEELQESLTAMLDGCAELARELKMSLPALVEMAVDRYARAHDKQITHFDAETEPDGHTVAVVMTNKWRGN